MDFSKILEYQKKDSELIKLERELSCNQNKITYTKMYNVVKDAQNKSNQLNNMAKSLIEEIDSLKKSYANNVKSLNIIENRNLDNSKEEDLDYILEISKNITNNLSVIEKKIITLSEKLNEIIVSFNNTKQKNKQAIDEYKKHKDLFEQEAKKLEPEIEKIKKELLLLEKNVPENLFAKYKKSRQDNVYPVFVKVNKNCCGGCSVELPATAQEKLKKDGFLECEHCRRIIYGE